MAYESSGLILLVEDHPLQRRLFGDILSSQGYTVFSAENVKEAEQFLLGHVPALILLDIMMPEIDGIEACRRFRKTLGNAIPVLFLTAIDTLEVVLSAMKAGGDDYIVKTEPPTVLVQRVRHWLADSHQDLPERRAKAVAYLEARLKMPKLAAGA